MKYVKGIVIYLLGNILCIGQTTAGSNPIEWSLEQAFPNSVNIGATYTATYTLTNTLPIQLVNPLAIIYEASPSNEFTYSDQCTGQRLMPNASCQIAISLTPVVSGEKRVQVTITGYDKNSIQLPNLVTSATSLPPSPPFTAGVTGVVTTPLPVSTDTTATNLPFLFTFSNHSIVATTSLLATLTTTGGSIANVINNCNGFTLSQSSGSCTVSGNFTPASSPVLQSITANLTYGGVSGSPTTISTSTAVSTSSSFVGVAQPGLSPLLTPNTAYQETGVAPYFLFTNNTGSVANITGATLTNNLKCSASDGSDCSSLLSGFSTSCNSGSLPNGAQCYITVNFNTPAYTQPITYTLTATLVYGGSSTAAVITSGSMVAPVLPSSRVVQLVNNCPFTLSYSLHGGALGGVPTICPQGSTRYLDGNCYWDNYAGKSNILKSGETDRVIIPGYSYTYQGNPIQWSGNISASLGCAQPNGGSCTQATCNGDNGGTNSCGVAQGFIQPATQAEITMQANSQADSYDVEVINGFHIPISMTPYYYISSDGTVKIQATADNYNCGIPGNYFTGSSLSNGFGSCNWANATVPTPNGYYYNVAGGSGQACVATAPSCPSSQEVCGINASLKQVCGNFIGYWTPDQLCTQSFGTSSTSEAFYTGLSCATPTGYGIAGDPYNNTFTSLMACSKPISGNPAYNTCYGSYSTGTPSTCCGCVNWWESPTFIPGVNTNGGPGITVATCPSGYSSTIWTSFIQHGFQWLKTACPSSYVYPFDDQTSSFKCTNSTTQPNTTSYVVTFCPGGESGLPSGLNDGRG